MNKNGGNLRKFVRPVTSNARRSSSGQAGSGNKKRANREAGRNQLIAAAQAVGLTVLQYLQRHAEKNKLEIEARMQAVRDHERRLREEYEAWLPRSGRSRNF